MKRRNFIAFVGTLAGWPLAVRGQQGSGERLIGMLSPISEAAAVRAAGRYSRPQRDTYNSDHYEFFAGSSGHWVGQPRPGGNVTGFWWGDEALVGKRLELLKRAVPGIERVGLIFNPDDPTDSDAAKAVAEVSKTLGLAIRILEVSAAAQLQEAFATARRESLQGLAIASGPLFVSSRAELAKFALAARLPTIGGFRDFPIAGTLASYGANLSDLYRREAGFIDRVFKGASPADMPIERPTKFEFVINLKTAKAFGLTISPALIAQADEVIE